MKRPPHRVKHACLKQFRGIAGITQSELAKMIGVSDAAIIAIEAGYLQMSAKMARRIMSRSGVLWRSLLEPTGRPLDLDSQPYTHERYIAFRDAQKLKFDPDSRKILLPKGTSQKIESSLAEHRALSRAAAITGKLPIVEQLWREWLVFNVGDARPRRVVYFADGGTDRIWQREDTGYSARHRSHRTPINTARV